MPSQPRQPNPNVATAGLRQEWKRHQDEVRSRDVLLVTTSIVTAVFTTCTISTCNTGIPLPNDNQAPQSIEHDHGPQQGAKLV